MNLISEETYATSQHIYLYIWKSKKRILMFEKCLKNSSVKTFQKLEKKMILIFNFLKKKTKLIQNIDRLRRTEKKIYC